MSRFARGKSHRVLGFLAAAWCASAAAPSAHAALTPGGPPACGSTRTGCSTLDLVQSPSLLVDPSIGGVTEAVLEVEDGMYREGVLVRDREARDLAHFRRRLLKALSSLDDARVLLPEGDVCRSAHAMTRAELDLEQLSLRVEKRMRALERARKTRLERTFGDAGEREQRWQNLHYLQGLFDAVRDTTEGGAVTLDETCRSLRSKSVAGKVVKVDDLHRRVRLDDGTVLGLKHSGYDTGIHPGVEIAGTATVFADGGLFFEDVAALPTNDLDADPGKCIGLRFAPIQPWWPEFPYGEAAGTNGRAGLEIPPPGTAPYVLHHPEAYRLSPSIDYHVVEQEMRLAAVREYCLTDLVDEPLEFHRYSMDIELEIGGKKHYVAWHLEPGDAPTGFSAFDLSDAGPGKLKVKVKQQVCHYRLDLADEGIEPDVSWTDIQACSDPDATSCPIQRDWDDFDDWVEPYECSVPVVFRTETLNVDFVPRGDMCSVTYEDTLFDLEDDSLTSVRSTRASGWAASGLGEVTFWADGYAASTPAPAPGGKRVASPITVTGNQPFGVFSWEPCTPVLPNGDSSPTSGCRFPEDKQSALRRAGVATASALRWPRIVGLRDGKQYAYTCTLPKLVRDVIDFCPNLPHTFYRFPYDPSEGAIEMGQANCDCDDGCTHCCGCDQKYAFDIRSEEYTLLRAARGGKVIDVYGGSNDNCWDEECPNGGHWGNFVTIKHQDGTKSTYMHMPFSGPAVAVGDWVRRGDEIGQSGNTGNSSGPHLHLQEHTKNGVTSQMRFELGLVRYRPKRPAEVVGRTCYTPERGDDIVSTNQAPQ